MKQKTQTFNVLSFLEYKKMGITKLFSVFVAFSFCFSLTAQTASRPVQGTVTDTKGEPLAAGISIKGTTAGTVTDPNNGTFILNIPNNNAVLVVQSIGFKTKELSVGTQRTVAVQLDEDVLLLDELVVVGYGTQKKATLTGAVAAVKGEDLQKVPVTNLTSTLTGRMAGVIINTRGSDPGSEEINVNIRGKSTWQGGDPLVIVDGIANRSGWDRINPDEIESISVLKDASAAIYGSRAANGVILITTKRGNDSRPVLEYHGDVGFTQITKIPEMTRSWQYATYYTEAKRSGYTFTDEEIEKFKQGSDPNLFPNYDMRDYVLRSAAPQTTHTLSLHGGNDVVKYYISGRYLYQDAVYKNSVDNFASYGIRSNIDLKVANNLHFSISIDGRRDDKQRSADSDNSRSYVTAGGFSGSMNTIDGAKGFFEELLGTDPTKPVFYSNGLPAPIYDKNLVRQIEGASGLNNERTSTINSQYTVRWDLPFVTKGLYMEGTYAYDFSNDRTKQFSKSYDLYSYDSSTDTYVNLNTNPVMNRSLYDYYYNSYSYTLNARIGYERVFNSIHNLSAFIAYEQYSNNTEWINATRSSFLTDQIPYQFAGDPDTQKNDGSGTEYAYRNAFGRIAYSYADKYMLDFTLRRDESLKFAPQNRVGWFPGISAGWRISEEKFMKDHFKALDNMKLRASWGQMGSDNVADYQYLATAALQASSDSYVLGADPKVVSSLYFTGTPNPNIRWEVANTVNAGIDGSMWNGKLGLEADYFFSKRSNILATRNASVPLYTGLTLPDENIGKAQNQGIELTLSTRNKIQEFSYNISANFTYTTNKIIYMDESPNVPAYQRQEGHPIDSWLLYRTGGIFKTQEQFDNTPAKRPGAQLGDIIYLDMDGNGQIDDNDKVRLYESSMPKCIFGFNVDLNYKGFDFSMLWQGQSGAKTYINPTTRNGDINIPMWLYNGRWTPETAESATMPRAFYHRSETANTIPSDFWLKDASFLRLKSLELGYNIPKKIISNVAVSSAKIYVSGFNLLLFDKIHDYDPEVVNDLGVFYPPTRVYNVGVHITF